MYTHTRSLLKIGQQQNFGQNKPNYDVDLYS